MRLFTSIIYGLAAAQLTLATLGYDQSRNLRRDESSAVAQVSSNPSPSTTFSASPSSTVAGSISRNSTFSISPTSALDSLPAITSTSSSTSTDNSTAAASTSDDGLPLEPIVTPAIGIAGFILLVTGLVYGVVGIKIRGIYIFFSTAYLTALAVTVLILYVMNPPVSNGIQGAFLVAVLAAGCIFGGLSLIFYEITKGFGCALGGFSLAMWFLTLAQDGLIHSKTMRVVFIVVFMAATSALAIPKFTREYALIGSLPFAGATAAILGIDCFSRAGLKEFWIYLWDLNDNIFPPNTQGYPITRGMRVESAGIILLFLFGLVAQLKLFKLVQRRREEKKQAKQEQQQDTEKRELAIGRQLEADVERDRARWEAVYGNGNKTGVTATLASTDSRDDITLLEKRSSSAMESTMVKALPAGHPVQKNDSAMQVTVVAVDEDAIEEASDEYSRSRAQSTLSKGRRSLERLGASSPIEETSTAPTTAPASARNSLQPGITTAPEVTPLPFRIPTVHRNSQGPVNRNSMGSLYDEVGKRTSNAVRHVRSFNSSIPTSASQEELMMTPPRLIRDDRSSIAATVDDLDEDDFPLEESLEESDVPNTDIRKSMLVADDVADEDEAEVPSTEDSAVPLGEAAEKSTTEPDTVNIEPSESEEKVAPEVMAQDEIPSETPAGSMTEVASSQQVPNAKDKDSTDEDIPDTASDLQTRRARKASMKSTKTTASTARQFITDDNLKQLPAPISKVVLSYRTNEWAKHLEAAEQPAIDIQAAPPSPGIAVETVYRQEADLASPNTPSPKPGYVSGQEAPIPLLLGQASSSSPAETPTSAAQKRLSNTGSKGPRYPVNPYVPEIGTQSRPLSRQMSVTHSRPGSIAMAPAPVRSFSSPMIPEAISEQPQDLPTRMGTVKTIGSNYAPTLLDQRTQTLSERMSSMSFNNIQGITTNMIQATSRPGTAMSFQASGVTMTGLQGMAPATVVNDPALDDLPLTERKAILHGARRASGNSLASLMTPYPLNRSSTQPTPSLGMSWGPAASTMNLLDFNSHQPERNPSIHAAVRQGTLYNNWRETLNKEFAPGSMLDHNRPAADEQRRAAMIHEKRWDAMRSQQQQQANLVRDANFDSMMRRGDMLDLHREAMRKMQANAPRGDL